MLQPCRLCLNEVLPGFFFKINNFSSPNIVSTKEKLIVLLPEIDFDIVTDPIICRQCYINIEFCYNFKTSCLENDFQVNTCLQSLTEQENNYDLSEIVKKLHKEPTEPVATSNNDGRNIMDPENLLTVVSMVNYDSDAEVQVDECGRLLLVDSDDDDDLPYVENLCPNKVQKTSVETQTIEIASLHNNFNTNSNVINKNVKASSSKLQNNEKSKTPNESIEILIQPTDIKQEFDVHSQVSSSIISVKTESSTSNKSKRNVERQPFVKFREFFKVYMREHENSQYFVCPACKKRYKSATQIREHFYTTRHYLHIGQKTTSKRTVNKKAVTIKKRIKKSPIKKTNIPGDVKIKSTNKIVKKEIIISSGVNVIDDEDVKPILLDSNQVGFCCDLCKKYFLTRSLLLNHQRKHLKMFCCPTCKNVFFDEKGFNNHMQLVHAGKAYYMCRFCRKVFSNATICNTHESRHLSQVKTPYECEMCFFYFKNNGNLQKHFNEIHVNPRKFQCKICQKYYSRKYRLNTHMLNKHGQNP